MMLCLSKIKDLFLCRFYNCLSFIKTYFWGERGKKSCIHPCLFFFFSIIIIIDHRQLIMIDRFNTMWPYLGTFFRILLLQAKKNSYTLFINLSPKYTHAYFFLFNYTIVCSFPE